jgi:hypothetical protein
VLSFMLLDYLKTTQNAVQMTYDEYLLTLVGRIRSPIRPIVA